MDHALQVLYDTARALLLHMRKFMTNVFVLGIKNNKGMYIIITIILMLGMFINILFSPRYVHRLANFEKINNHIYCYWNCTDAVERVKVHCLSYKNSQNVMKN